MTTDYLLKGIEPVSENTAQKRDARIFSLAGSVFDFIGLVTAIMLWEEKQTSFSVAAGLGLMAIGVMVFAIGQFNGKYRETASFGFWAVNVWFLLLLPFSCLFNSLQGILFGHWWTFTPIPQMGNSVTFYALGWMLYFVVCAFIDFLLIKQKKR